MMKRFIWIIAATVAGCTNPSTSPERTGLPQYTVQTSGRGSITNYETTGNLQSNATLGCVPISTVTNKHTPADIYPGVAACVKAGDYEKATQLYVLAGTFGRFDQLRVSDRSARQAVTVLQLNNFADFTDEQRASFKSALLPRLDQGSSSLATLCAEVQRVGRPDYVPYYMIQHGTRAFLGSADGGLSLGFEPAQGWQDALSSYMHCS